MPSRATESTRSSPALPSFIAVTGGPGAGKTAFVELLRRQSCRHLAVLPESASILFGGGFPRGTDEAGTRAAQRAIYRVQVELERPLRERGGASVVLCDRGTVDGSAYWPGPSGALWREVGTSEETELSRYAAVVHLATPEAGYDHRNPVRIETAEQARALDRLILSAWARHPRRIVIPAMPDFFAKMHAALEAVRSLLPTCCPEGEREDVEAELARAG